MSSQYDEVGSARNEEGVRAASAEPVGKTCAQYGGVSQCCQSTSRRHVACGHCQLFLPLCHGFRTSTGSTPNAQFELGQSLAQNAYLAMRPQWNVAVQDRCAVARRVACRVDWHVVSPARFRGPLSAFANPLAVHLQIGECYSDKREQFWSETIVG